MNLADTNPLKYCSLKESVSAVMGVLLKDCLLAVCTFCKSVFEIITKKE